MKTKNSLASRKKEHLNKYKKQLLRNKDYFTKIFHMKHLKPKAGA